MAEGRGTLVRRGRRSSSPTGSAGLPRPISRRRKDRSRPASTSSQAPEATLAALARTSKRPTSGRGSHMHILRAGFLLVVAWSASFSDTLGAGVGRLALISLGYASLLVATDRAVRAWPRMQSVATVIVLVADGAFLAWILHLSGGTLSPLRFLVYIHLIVATLVYSYRVGIAVTLMHCALFYVLYRTQSGAVIYAEPAAGAASEIGEGGMDLRQSWIFNTFVLWLIALATAPFASVNERELRRRKDDLSALADMAADFENLHDPRAIAGALLDRTCESFGFRRGVVLAVRDDDLVVVAQRGTTESGTAWSRVDRLIDKAWDGHEALLVARLDEGLDPYLAKVLPDASNLLIAPMFADGQPFGVVALESAHGDQGVIQRRIISLVMQFASHAALAMRNAWLLQQVQSLAETDALTGVANRRSFETALARDVSRSIRSGEPLTLVLLDLDHFKQLNDRLGHQAGDDVLRKVGAVLRRACRESDVPARYGGEEFAILLPGCPKEESFRAAERLRALIAEIEAPVRVRASAGVATYPLNASNPMQLVAAADEALYHAKRMGRNRSTLSPRRVLRAVATRAAG